MVSWRKGDGVTEVTQPPENKRWNPGLWRWEEVGSGSLLRERDSCGLRGPQGDETPGSKVRNNKHQKGLWKDNPGARSSPLRFGKGQAVNISSFEVKRQHRECPTGSHTTKRPQGSPEVPPGANRVLRKDQRPSRRLVVAVPGLQRSSVSFCQAPRHSKQPPQPRTSAGRGLLCGQGPVVGASSRRPWTPGPPPGKGEALGAPRGIDPGGLGQLLPPAARRWGTLKGRRARRRIPRGSPKALGQPPPPVQHCVHRLLQGRR